MRMVRAKSYEDHNQHYFHHQDQDSYSTSRLKMLPWALHCHPSLPTSTWSTLKRLQQTHHALAQVRYDTFVIWPHPCSLPTSSQWDPTIVPIHDVSVIKLMDFICSFLVQTTITLSVIQAQTRDSKRSGLSGISKQMKNNIMTDQLGNWLAIMATNFENLILSSAMCIYVRNTCIQYISRRVSDFRSAFP